MWARTIRRLGIALAGVSSLIVLLALVVGRALPGVGAIAFFWYHDGVPDIYALDLGHGTLANITHSGRVTGVFALSSDGQRLAFEAIHENGVTQIQVMDVYCQGLIAPCDSSPQPLTDSEADSRSPVWSPDGRYIAFFYNVVYAEAGGEILVMNLTTGEIQRFLYNSTLMYPLSWTPESRLIVDTFDGSQHAVYSVGMDGSDTRTVAALALGAGVPVWSPDGSRFAYLWNSNGGVGELRFTYADGSDANITLLNVDTNVSPSWSPDGSRIAFISVHPDGDYLSIMDADVHSIPVGDLLYSSLAWSPDGQRIAFNRFFEGLEDLYLLEIESGEIRRLTYSGAVGFPTWMP